jgi:hypothetical protein
METTEEVRDVPFTVQKPVTERVTYQVPVQKMRWEEEELVRQIPYTVQRIEYEEVVQQTPVKVCRYVTETKAVQVPHTVCKWVAQTSMRLQPRIETYRVTVGPYYEGVIVDSATPSYRVPTQRPAVQPSQKPVTNGTGTNGAATGTAAGAGTAAASGTGTTSGAGAAAGAASGAGATTPMGSGDAATKSDSGAAAPMGAAAPKVHQAVPRKPEPAETAPSLEGPANAKDVDKHA